MKGNKHILFLVLSFDILCFVHCTYSSKNIAKQTSKNKTSGTTYLCTVAGDKALTTSKLKVGTSFSLGVGILSTKQ